MNDETNEKEPSDGQIYAAVSRKASPEMHAKIDAFLDDLKPVVMGSPYEIYLCYGELEHDDTHKEISKHAEVCWSVRQEWDSDVKYIRADIVAEKDAEIEQLNQLARDAYSAWDSDQDPKVGKLLAAMINPVLRKTYRPDLVKK